MPQIGFVCPDGGQVEFQECFSKCRMGERCLSIRTLKAIAERRDCFFIAKFCSSVVGN